MLVVGVSGHGIRDRVPPSASPSASGVCNCIRVCNYPPKETYIETIFGKKNLRFEGAY